MTNYADHVTDRLAGIFPTVDRWLLRMYALLAMTTGTATTSEHVHDAWSLWRTFTDPGHRSIVPFDELTPEVQALDVKYAQAIRVIAADLERGAAR